MWSHCKSPDGYREEKIVSVFFHGPPFSFQDTTVIVNLYTSYKRLGVKRVDFIVHLTSREPVVLLLLDGSGVLHESLCRSKFTRIRTHKQPTNRIKKNKVDILLMKNLSIVFLYHGVRFPWFPLCHFPGREAKGVRELRGGVSVGDNYKNIWEVLCIHV